MTHMDEWWQKAAQACSGMNDPIEGVSALRSCQSKLEEAENHLLNLHGLPTWEDCQNSVKIMGSILSRAEAAESKLKESEALLEEESYMAQGFKTNLEKRTSEFEASEAKLADIIRSRAEAIVGEGIAKQEVEFLQADLIAMTTERDALRSQLEALRREV